MCTLPKPPAGRALSEGKEAPQAAFPSFEKFYKSDKSRSNVKDSLGLGLYICKTIVDLHGGSIKAQSEDDKYTEFSVILPINYFERS